ncbi:carcinoembryonic antigen-related cell adhesion molecule 5 isoform X1 [Carassius gibelio]|uniref:carcinoembryonic antigen-related cell adhesion molecule 5 isoform X1 n=1 Tax=Carassius gibelio TaxID=101364 RepID=UPI0022778659|nr:carcinoembryonic antigen-related cell adhesion molecule 5 isoform X1 [Carassius gibelio]
MTCQHSLLFLFLSGFAALYVAEICETDLLEGTSCTFELPTKNTDKSNEITWVHLSSDAVIHWKNRRMRKITPGLIMKEDGSLTFESVSLKNTGRYRYTVFNEEGTQLDAGEKEIKVYANAPKPTVKINKKYGITTLTCDFRHRTDLTVSWYKEDNIIQNENNPNLLLTSAQVQENKPYSCSVSNPVSKEQSDSITVSFSEICKTDLLEGTSCTIKLPTKNTDKSYEIRWIHRSSDDRIHRKNGKIRKPIPGLTMEEDGSLTFESVSLKNSGRYTYSVFNYEGTELDAGEKEIKVYANAPKPTVKINNEDGITTLTCDFGDRTDLTVSWHKEEMIIQNENNPNLLLTSAQAQENKLYFCSVSNPVSKEKSDSITVSFSEIYKTDLLEGTSCTIKLQTRNTDKSYEITWTHLSSDAVIQRKNGKIRKNTPGLTMEEDGSLTFESVSLKNSGRYTYTVFNNEGTQIDAGEKEIKVYANAPTPTVKIICKDGIATLTCVFRDPTNLNISWYKEGKIIQNKKDQTLVLTSDLPQENKPYSCGVSNPVSKGQSNSITSCTDTGPGSTDGTKPKLFGFDLWIMVSILAGGGCLLLLLICVLLICACRSCKKQKQHEQDEEELRLRIFHDEGHNGTARSKHTARGQPAPPIPQEDTSPQTPTQTQPKAQARGRPPPPPEEDDENPPPLPRPRNKQHRRKHEEPYRPME